MGNKWNAERLVICPPGNPYLDIHQVSDGSWEYVPSVGKDARLILYATLNPKDLLGSVQIDTATIQMLPPIEEPPPPPVSVSERIDAVLSELLDQEGAVRDLIMQNRGASAVAIEHGRVWGKLPVQRLAEKLQSLGIETEDTIVSLGRGKRIPQHALLLR